MEYKIKTLSWRSREATCRAFQKGKALYAQSWQSTSQGFCSVIRVVYTLAFAKANREVFGLPRVPRELHRDMQTSEGAEKDLIIRLFTNCLYSQRAKFPDED